MTTAHGSEPIPCTHAKLNENIASNCKRERLNSSYNHLIYGFGYWNFSAVCLHYAFRCVCFGKCSAFVLAWPFVAFRGALLDRFGRSISRFKFIRSTHVEIMLVQSRRKTSNENCSSHSERSSTSSAPCPLTIQR